MKTWIRLSQQLSYRALAGGSILYYITLPVLPWWRVPFDPGRNDEADHGDGDGDLLIQIIVLTVNRISIDIRIRGSMMGVFVLMTFKVLLSKGDPTFFTDTSNHQYGKRWWCTIIFVIHRWWWWWHEYVWSGLLIPPSAVLMPLSININHKGGKNPS